MRDLPTLQRTFGAVPGLFLVLRPDADLTIAAASADYLTATHCDDGILGQPLRTVFAPHLSAKGAEALQALQASLQRVASTGRAETMPVEQFDLRPAPGSAASTAFAPRFWLPVNSPVIGDDGRVELVIHHVHEAAAKANQDAIGILDSITEGFYTLDREWRFDYVNREACRILARQPGELHGQVVWEAYPGLEGTEIERRYLRAMDHREKGSFTAWYAGHERWYEITVFPAPEGISVFFRNVTEQKTVEAQRDALLADSEQQRRIYETALDSIPDLVYVFDLEHRVLYANAPLKRVWGMEAVRGKRLLDFGYDPDEAALQEGEIDEAIATRKPLQRQTWHTGANGRRLYDYVFAPVLAAQGEVVAVAGTARDVTDQQQIAVRLGETQRLEAIGTLAGGVAHDFNNMLAAILVNVALAEQEIAPASPAAERLALVHRAAERARSLVRQILTFSRRAPKLLQIQALQPLVDEAIALLRSTLPPTVHVVVRPAATPQWALVDATQFQQMVVNLSTNAWQALREERGTVRVSLAKVDVSGPQAAALALRPGPYVRLRVSDNGLGMDDGVRAHIFEPFFTTKPVGHGTGLGLAVVHGIATESAGAISVISRPLRGTSIAVYLPWQPPQDGGRSVALPAVAHAEAASAGRVLYVDDDELVSLTAAALLTRAGFALTCVPDGRAALAALREAPDAYVAVVTDFNMPTMSGLVLAEAVRREAPQAAVLIVSGLVTDELQAAASRLGVREVVFKEHMIERLVDAVRAAVAPPKAVVDATP